MEDATTTESVDAPQPAANGGSVAAKRPVRKGKLGKTLGSHVDPSASAFPVSLLSDNAAEGLRPQRDSGILTGAMTKSAVFWDRDNTLIEDPGYLSDPAQVKLLSGASAALRRLADAGYENIVITNQSGIARGLFDEAALEKVHARLQELLAGEGARLDAIYYCPYLDGPEAVVEKYRQDSDLRKPRPGMLAQASLERKIDLAGSWMIGNSLGDTQAGRAAGCRTILVAGDDAAKDKSVDFVARSLEEAAGIVLKYTAGAQAAIPSEPPARPDAAAADAVRKELTVVGSRVEEILSFLRMVDRRQQAEDFSLGRLVGIVVQMVAVAAMVWAIFSFIRSEEYGAQIVRLLFALVLQMLALTCFLLSSRK
jgi:D,D-heptose 1,7-bisphosphate phosphatase